MIAIKDKAIRIINDIQLANSLGVLFSTKRNLFSMIRELGNALN